MSNDTKLECEYRRLDELTPCPKSARTHSGETLPVDGVVEDGRSSLDEAMVTGESMPVMRTVGDHVIGGTMNRTGALVIRAEKVGRDTMLSRIVQMVADAQRSRAPIQRMADQVSGWFVPLVIVAAAAMALSSVSVIANAPRLRGLKLD